MKTGERKIGLEHLLALNMRWSVAYSEFVKEVPASWKPWFNKHKLMAIACRYGQNIVIKSSEDLASQKSQWKLYHRYDKLRFMSFAIATDFMYVF